MGEVTTIILAMELAERLKVFRLENKYDECFASICDVDEAIVVDFDKALDNLLHCYLQFNY
tara:strand:- start:765 stop:947 length:183 start_codon:yes stop_codon:yes gene_type:complete